mgnify:FL=1
MAVSAVGYRVIERAVVIRLNKGEALEDIITSYSKLSTEQAEQLRKKFATEE